MKNITVQISITIADDLNRKRPSLEDESVPTIKTV